MTNKEKQKKDLLSNIDTSKFLEESDTLTSNASNSVSQEKEESKEEMVRVVSDEPTAPFTFLSNNQKIIGLNRNQFREWLKLNYIAFGGSGRFIPTDDATKKGYMINENEYLLKLKPIIKNEDNSIDIHITCRGKLTKQGQEFILDKIAKEREQENV